MDNRIHPEFNVEQKQYLFDISNQSQEQVLAILKRADKINTVAAPEFGQLNIILILDGADISWFLTSHYVKKQNAGGSGSAS